MSVLSSAGFGLPKIDVLLPTYKTITLVGEDVLRQQVDSILSQCGVAVRILLTDDCSPDETFEFLRESYRDEPRIILKRNSTNLGQMATLASLLLEVQSDYFAFCDHDDVWLSSKLKVNLAQLLRENTDLAYSDLFLVDENLSVIAKSAMAASGISSVSGRHPLSILLKNPVHGCTILARSNLICEALPIAEGIPFHDRYFALLASCRKGISYCESQQVLYRQHGDNTVGAVARNLSGFTHRSRAGLGSYLSTRLANRRSYLDAWMRWEPKSKSAAFLAFHARQPMAIRFLLLPGYITISVAGAHRIGLLTIVVDTILTLFASRARSL